MQSFGHLCLLFHERINSEQYSIKDNSQEFQTQVVLFSLCWFNKSHMYFMKENSDVVEVLFNDLNYSTNLL